jgi:DNA-binding CsgD family transcriptional regulator
LLVVPTRSHLVTSSTGLRPFVQQHFKLPYPDPREQRVTPRIDEGFMADYAYFSPKEIARDPYYQEFLVPSGFGWNAAAALGGDLLISLKRAKKRGAYEADDLGELNTVLPWLRSAARAASASWRVHFSGQLRAFEQLGRGAILIDARARVLDNNSCVQFGDGLDVSGGCLLASRPTDRMRLQRFLTAVTAAHPSSHTVPSSLILPRPSGLRPWLLDAIACTEALRSLHSQAAALLLITDLERPTRLATSRLREAFGLTGTEGGLAHEIMLGRSLREAAHHLGISEGHARQRLKDILLKTGTSRQAELVALLAKLS